MNQSIISARGVSKMFIIGNKKPYYTLRETISEYVKNLFAKKKITKFWALKKVSFDIKQGEMVGMIGGNGAGKSTMLKILSRITPPTEGKIEINGRITSLLEVGTGFHPELTGKENIFFNGCLLGMTTKEIREKFNDIVEFAGIDKFIDTPVKKYSSGMYVRLAFSVAAHLESEILLIDEVLAVGDTEFQKKCIGKIDDVTKKGRTVIFVSHNMALIKSLCKRCLLLKDGKIIFDGETDKAINKYLESYKTGSNALIDRKDRLGNKNAMVTKIDIVNLTHKNLQFRMGDSIMVRLHYVNRIHKDIKRILVGITIKNQMGIRLFIQHNKLSGDKITLNADGGVLACTLPGLPLIAGRYYITYSFLEHEALGGDYIDSIENAVSFDVEEADYFGTGELPHPEHGLYLMKGKWTQLKKD